MEAKVKHLLHRASILEPIVEIEPLEQGYSNHCFRVKLKDGRVYKARIGDNNDVIDRRNELQILRNIGLDLPYYDPETGDSLWHWIEGISLLGSPFPITKELIHSLVPIIGEIHSKETKLVKNHDDLEYLERFGHLLGEENRNLYRQLVKKYSSDRRCLCHNDISLSNLIYEPKTKNLTLIDYEWGRVNNGYWDYGNFIKEANLSRELTDILIAEANLDPLKAYEFAILATLYSIQLSYAFRNQTPGLDRYRERLFRQLEDYRQWIHTRR